MIVGALKSWGLLSRTEHVVYGTLGEFLFYTLALVFATLWFIKAMFDAFFRFEKRFIIKTPKKRQSTTQNSKKSNTDNSGLRQRKQNTSVQTSQEEEKEEEKIHVTLPLRFRVLLMPFVTTVIPFVLYALFVRYQMLPVVDSTMNGMRPLNSTKEIWKLAETSHPTFLEYKKQHDRFLFTADLHADTVMWTSRNFLKRNTFGHVDMPRMIEGNLAMQVFSSVTKATISLSIDRNNNKTDMMWLVAAAQLWPQKTWNSMFEKAMYYSTVLQQWQDQSNNQFIFVKTKGDLERLIQQRKSNQKVVSGLWSIEGAHCLEEKLENLDSLLAKGVRMFGLTHFSDTEVGGSAHGEEKYGLTRFGRKVIDKLVENQVIIDFAHSSEKLIEDVLQYIDTHHPRKPVFFVASHTGFRGFCDNNRNLRTDLAKRIVQKGGVLGVGFWKETICELSIDKAIDAFDYAIKEFGEDAIALGSDFDGSISTMIDASKISYIGFGLKQRGYSIETIEKVMGGNFLKLLRKSLTMK